MTDLPSHRFACLYTILMVFPPSHCLQSTPGTGENYNVERALLKDKLGPSVYDTDLRPLRNTSHCISVSFLFSLNSIVEVDDVTQRFTVNGFVRLSWEDQMVRWDPKDYDGINTTHVRPSRLWRPRMMIINTLTEYDPFDDHYSTINIQADGHVWWVPGGVFSTTCQLHMTNYPFDTQTCYLMMCPISYLYHELVFVEKSKNIGRSFFVQNKGWTLVKAHVSVFPKAMDVENLFSSCVQMAFRMKRRPAFFVFNVILPIIILSFLNNIVFLIPIDSGERISYVITVMLSLSVMLGTLSTMVPQASDVVPAITVYLFVLLVESGFSVLASIAIEYLHHRNQHDSQESISKRQASVGPSNGTELRVIRGDNDYDGYVTSDTGNSLSRNTRFRRNALSAAMVNTMCFGVSMLLWAAVNIWFFVKVLS